MESYKEIAHMLDLLVSEGIYPRVTAGPSGWKLWFEDGFYKSDGCTYLEHDGGKYVLHARYNETTVVEDIEDIVRESKQWFDYSHNRCSVWEFAPAHWERLYKQYL